ncbi:heptaprenyl diphosphate synthase subunit I [Insulibacter thermoxylanivorax]|uniref:Heptaprenyl diphosphate synthase subunit I n=1 Tax=Insulibacter thermoxylanivorax TaxID=2749268 RepID=A0A916QEV6_9BACL|nr:Gx transporter family protein [Insulibacter thermoxylanivorax]GFR39467.1 heptaprenyl diphosphate synthase subunit I [Insulibacter thermoxylanivorax]
MRDNQRIVYIALLASQGVVISLIERAIPFPFAFAPGAKLGLANIITLMALYTLPAKDVSKVIAIRITLAMLLGGTISSFLYSASGALLSFLGMWTVKQLGPARISLIGVSMTGAMLHNIGQLLTASWIAGTWTVMLYLPFLSLMGMLSGFAVGVFANYLLTHVDRLRVYQRYQERQGWAR